MTTEYDKRVVVDAPFTLHGKSVSALGANADFVFDSFSLFGELAGNSLNAQSAVVGFLCRVSKRLSISSQLRSYSMEYAGPYAYGFGEQNGVVNGENGLYLGMEYQASNEVKISTSCNEFTLPSTGAFTTTGADDLIRCEGALAKSVNLFLQFKDNSKSQESIILDAESDPQKIFEERDQENLRASCSFALNKWSEFVQRIELTTVSYSISQRRSTGVLMFTEVNLFPPHRCF